MEKGIYGKNNNNELNKKKYKHALSYFNPDAGNVEYNVSMFNKMNGTGDISCADCENGAGISEELKEKVLYKYKGPVSRFGQFVGEMEVETQAYDKNEAIRNIVYKIKQKLGLEPKSRIEIDPSKISVVKQVVNKDASDINSNPKNFKKKLLYKYDEDSDTYITSVNDKIIFYRNGKYYVDGDSVVFETDEEAMDYLKEDFNSMTVIEKLNMLDRKAIDENLKYYDLRNLYEATMPQLTAKDKQEVQKVMNSTNDPATIAAVIQAKALDKKESLTEEEDVDSIDRSDEIRQYEDLYSVIFGWIYNSIQEDYTSPKIISDVKKAFPYYREDWCDKEGFSERDLDRTVRELSGYLASILCANLQEDFTEGLADDIRKGNLRKGNSLARNYRNEKEVEEASAYDDEFDFWWGEDPETNTEIQIQDRENHEYNLDSPTSNPKVSSHSWGRVWKNGKLDRQFEGPKNIVRQDMAKYLEDNE